MTIPGQPGDPRPDLSRGSHGRLTAELGLKVLEGGVQVPDRVVAALRIAGVRERMRHEPAESSLVDHDVDILDEIGRRRAAVALDAVELTRLNRLDDRLEVGRPQTVHTLGVDDGAVGEDLQEHAELAAVVGSAQRESGQDGVGGRDRRAHPRPAGTDVAAQTGRCGKWRGRGDGVWGNPSKVDGGDVGDVGDEPMAEARNVARA